MADAAACRAHFAALRCARMLRRCRPGADVPLDRSGGDGDDAWAFLENAGGSRVPDCVADAAARYFRDSYVQARARRNAQRALGPPC
jgi:hypothetical protein